MSDYLVQQMKDKMADSSRWYLLLDDIPTPSPDDIRDTELWLEEEGIPEELERPPDLETKG